MMSQFEAASDLVTKGIDNEFKQLLQGNSYLLDVESSKEEKLLCNLIGNFGIAKNIQYIYDHWIDNVLPAQLQTNRKEFKDGIMTFAFLGIEKPKKLNRLSATYEPDTPEDVNDIFTPLDARNQGETYGGRCWIEMKFTYFDESKPPITKNVMVATIPIMLGTKRCHLYGKTPEELRDIGECPNDPLGYFIIKGTERVVIIQENLRTSLFLTYYNESKNELQSRITCVTPTGTSVVSMRPGEDWSIIEVSMSHLGKGKFIPLFTAFDLLGFRIVNDGMVTTLIKLIARFLPDDPSVFKLLEALLQSSIVESRHIGNPIDYLRELRGVGKKSTPTSSDSTTNGRNKVQETSISDETISRDAIEGLFPHIFIIYPDDPVRTERETALLKAAHLAFMTAELCANLIGYRKLDNQDSWSNKMLKTAAKSIEQLFKGALDQYLQKSYGGSVGTTGGRDPFMPPPNKSITDQINSSFTGAWGLRGTGSKMKENITDSVKRLTPATVISQIGKINTPTARQTKKTEIRQIQNTQIGYLCPAETPEGKHIGLIKNQAVLNWVSSEYSRDDVEELLFKECLGLFVPIVDYTDSTDIKDNILNRMEYHTHLIVIVGKIFGWCYGPELASHLRYLRKTKFREYPCLREACILFNENRCTPTLEIYCDAGRPTRPLLVVNQETNELIIDEINGWDMEVEDLFNAGAIEMIDAREQEYIMLAMSPDHVRQRNIDRSNLMKSIDDVINKLKDTSNKEEHDKLSQEFNNLKEKVDKMNNEEEFTHSQVHPIEIMGPLGTICPKPECMQGPRFSYEIGMSKQAMNAYHTNHHLRFDASYKVLEHTSRPIFESKTRECFGLNDMPNGDMLITMFYALPGNYEDAIIMNEETVKSGKFKIRKYETYKLIITSDSSKGIREELYCPPNDDRNRYHALGNDGLPKIGSFLRKGDCVIGRRRMFGGKNNVVEPRTENASVYVGVGGSGVVDRVYINYRSTNKITIKVKILQERDPVVGDKFSSCYAQKGVIASIMPQKYLPRIASGVNKGMYADIYRNPHSMPSRMTSGEQQEIVTSAGALYTGRRVNATGFNRIDMDHYTKALEDNGLDPFCEEEVEVPVMICKTPGIGPAGMEPSLHYRKSRVKAFVGPCFYQSLKHHVMDKIQTRSRGTIKPVSNQPGGGRAADGGLRLGEMERDGLISHGATGILLERLMGVSDKCTIIICRNCGHISAKPNYCRKCSEKALNDFGVLVIPYVFVWLLHLLNAAGVDIFFETSLKHDPRSSIEEDKYIH